MNVCAVIVVYNRKFSMTDSFISLLRVAKKFAYINLHVIIYDNSDFEQEINTHDKFVFDSFRYVHDRKNNGVVPAYRLAKEYCIRNGIEWLCRLDQDSKFKEDLFVDFLNIAKKKTIGLSAIVPKIYCKNKLISPSLVHKGGIYTPIYKNSFGVLHEQITFINSMSFINILDTKVCSILDSLEFMLDLSDHEFALQLDYHSVYVLYTEVQHSLSIMESTYMSRERYTMLMECESKFVNRFEGTMGKFIYRLRLIFRCLKFVIKGQLQLFLITLRNI